MANPNPTDGSKVVPLDLSDAQVAILRADLTMCLEGVQGDLKTADEGVDLEKARQDAEAYERLLRSLDWGEVVVPDEAARSAIEAMALSADKAHNYAEVIATHDALFGLLAQLGGVKMEGR
ncbi:MAG TPA: hypothetical protein VIE64_07125 [Solirubrobacterales bacterium]|jgi:hypothetical protein